MPTRDSSFVTPYQSDISEQIEFQFDVRWVTNESHPFSVGVFHWCFSLEKRIEHWFGRQGGSRRSLLRVSRLRIALATFPLRSPVSRYKSLSGTFLIQRWLLYLFRKRLIRLVLLMAANKTIGTVSANTPWVVRTGYEMSS
jgi:hypothetical protein